jgi:hypothetical protein
MVRETEEDKRVERRGFIDSFGLGGWIDVSFFQRLIENIWSLAKYQGPSRQRGRILSKHN